MRLGGRLAAAIDILDDIERRHRPASEALKDWGVSHRFAGAGDRAAIGNIVHDGLRRRRSAGWLFASDEPRAVAFGTLLLDGDRSLSALVGELEGDKFAPPALSAEEIECAAARLTENVPDDIRADCPDWVKPQLRDAFGDGWVEEAAALARRPPLDLRVNTLKADPAKVRSALSRSNPVPGNHAAEALRITPIVGDGRHPNVQAEPAFQKGWFEVQDEGSQIVSKLAGAHEGMQVLDFCAGAGGKSLALSAIMGNHGQIFAHDTDKQRLAPSFERIRRAGCRNVQVLAESAALAPLEARMDIVLVDAPCTGSGTWRRRPDAKWRLSERQLQSRQAEQAAILEAAARYVRPGGRLAYVTCSVFEAENRHRVAEFLSHADDFASVDHRALWQEHFGSASSGARIDATGGIALTPASMATDGFFFAALEKRA